MKSQWDPVQCGELLGFIMDLRSGTFQVPPRRVDALKQLLNDTIAKKFVVSARHLSRITGSLVSMGLALGPVARLWTRALRHMSNSSLGHAFLDISGESS